VLAGIHAVESLARMGDLAAHIGEAVRRRHPRPVLPPVLRPRFTRMAELANEMMGMFERVVRDRDTIMPWPPPAGWPPR
jgi:phosphate transport system protein